ncbi:hypothetical protein HF521_003383 [Silurus meridionalis]|uniref:Tripartite motif-containing protein 16-like n=1 Tax=Silurus meridionalis TaxID=175797 RepID=A0A8T0B4F9_SILME|nr:hypothetical protein HF521_003383 [Silurus meridionalis]
MAEASISVNQDQFICAVCLDLLKDPVAIPCGHSYCKVCINSCWNQEDMKSIYSCPQCRETFTPRPVLRRNNMLAEVVEKLKKTELQAASPAHCYTGPADVDCDFCTEGKHKAVKSCLVCLASYCEEHLKPHYQSQAFKKHKLVEACVDLQEKICSQHNKLMEIYCRTDQSFICYLCMMDKHKGHDTVSTTAERSKKQNELKEEQIKSQQRIQEKQKKVQELKQTVDTIKKRSQAAVDDNEKIFNEVISSLVKRCSEVTELIRFQEKADLSRAEQHLKHLEQEITDLQRRVSDLEQLSHTPDHIHFLRSFPSLCVSPGCDDSPSFTVNQHLSFDGVRKSVSDLKKRVEEICQEEFNKIRPQAAAVQMIFSKPKSRADFLQYFCYLTLDPNTAHPQLILSEKNRVVTRSDTKQRYSDHPERFDSWSQVLCKESVCGRCYWEVKWSSVVYISVSYKEISRKGEGDECGFGCNSQSWSLVCSSSSVSFWHNNIKTALRGPASSRIGVYVDHSAGTLSFYSISDTMRLLHRVQTTFTQPLYAGFWMEKMAEACISVNRLSVDQFICAVCLDLLKDPVAIPCGHSYCKVCINGCWNQEDMKGIYSCPQCRETFTPRPVLRRNNMLAEVVEKLKNTELQAASPAHCYAGPGDVDCDSCTGRKLKAVKSCLVCLASYCEDHLKLYYQSQAFKKHKLVEACVDLQEKICSQHDKLMEIYCRTDQSFICYLCMMDEHKGHDTVSTTAERSKKQNELKEKQIKSQQKIQEKQKKVQELKQTVDIIKKRSQAAVDDNEKIFNEMISSLVKRRSDAMEMIRVQEKADLSQAEQHLKHLEQEITDLQRRVSELEQLSHTPDHIHFLQSFPSLCVSPGCDDSPSFTVNQHLSFDGVRKSVSDLKKQVKEICQEEFNKIRPQAAAVQMILPSEPKSRADFLQYFCYLTLDPNTAHPDLFLSEKNRVVRCSEKKQRYSDHPERFDSWFQVLCKESVCGRCYWEVEWSSVVYISVSYKEISRNGCGDECGFGLNSQSWSLVCSSSSVSFWHNNIKTALRGPASSRIGVYVDHSAGTLSFYSVSDTMRLLYKVQTTFTRTLYAGFCMDYYADLRFCDRK